MTWRLVAIYMFSVIPFFCWSQSHQFSGDNKKPDLEFNRISTAEGLSHSDVSCIIQDHQGFMWFGTADGLNKFDGYNVTIYRHTSGDSSSLVNSDIRSIFEDSDNNLWIGTSTGLNRYSRSSDKFIHHKEIINSSINNIFEDRDKNLWLTTGPHIYLFDAEQAAFRQCDYTWMGENIVSMIQDSRDTIWATMPQSIFNYNKREQSYVPRYWDDSNKVIVPEPIIELKNVVATFEDSQHNFWLASHDNGLYLYDRDKGVVIRNYKKTNAPFSIAGNALMAIAEDKKNNLWIGTQNSGLSLLKIGSDKFFNYYSNNLDPKSLSFNTVNVIYPDKNGNVWLGTHSGGVNFVQERKFRHHYVKSYDSEGLNNNNTTSFVEDKNGIIWIGTDGDGINLFDRNTDSFRHIKNAPDDNYNISANVITCMKHGSENIIWIGYWNGGVDKLDYDNKKILRFRHSDKDSTSLRNDNILHVLEDNNSDLWVATLSGLDILHENSQRFEHVDLGLGLENYVVSILEDENDDFWLGTWRGLKLFNKKTGEYQTFTHDPQNRKTLSNDKIFLIFRDSRKKIWIGTAGGLNLFDKKTRSFEHFHLSDGLPSEAIYGIIEDGENNLWLSTGNGISKFNPQSGTFKNYNVGDGLQGYEFKPNAHAKLESGELIFGGNNGFNIFDPNNIHENTFTPPVVFTDFKIFNTPVRPADKDSPLSQHISVVENITLDYTHSVFSIEFAALSFKSPEKNQFAYMLVGFDQDWIYAGNTRTVTYTNLDPGDYTFKVKASNSDGIWNEHGNSLVITITPPFWASWWFRTLLFIFLAGSFFVFYWLRIAVIERQKKKLEKKVKEQTSLIRNALAQLQQQNEDLEYHAKHLLAANGEIENQHEKLQALHAEIKDSIRAAQSIQQSILPSPELIKTVLPGLVIFNAPKDVVSGDFYWFKAIGEQIIILVADCSGHGVEGALMAVNGHHLINQVVSQQRELIASKILSDLDAEIRKMKQDNSDLSANTEMDLSLCILNKSLTTLQFAGAVNPLYLIRDKKLVQINADRFSVGFGLKDHINEYSNHQLDLKKGDMVYLFSDGFADQIGRNGTEKFMYYRFRKLLTDISDHDINTQENLLKNAFNNWKKSSAQIDDILIVGFKI